jgi:Uma2 family endonuclease
MAEAAPPRMTVEEFYRWDGEGDTRYQLFEGLPVAMPLTNVAHGTVMASLGYRIAGALDSKPGCRAGLAAGVRPVNRQASWYQADVVVGCGPLRRGGYEIDNPILIAEVLFGATEFQDRRIKVPDYLMIPSVQEVLLVDPERPYCELLRRSDQVGWTIEIVRDLDAAVPLRSIDLYLRMTQIMLVSPWRPDRPGCDRSAFP